MGFSQRKFAEKIRLTRLCRDCGQQLSYTERLGWVHDGPGMWISCPSRDTNRPTDDDPKVA